MKKNILIKAMGMMMACALVVGNTGMVAHAYVGDDGLVRDDVAAGGNDNSASISIGGGSSDSGNSGSSSSGGGSSSSAPSYDDGYVRDNVAAGGNDNSASVDIGGGSTASYSAPAPKAVGSATSVTGKETFRAVAKAGDGTYKVIHKGVDIATFHLMKTDKTAVSCTKVALKQRDDGKWAINYEVADATDLTVGAPLDRTYMYNTLGVSYVTINDTVIIDIEAEAQAAATK